MRERLIGIVSRGGSLLAKWMLHHGAQNPMYTLWDDICQLLRRYDVTFSIGDGLRPGGLSDATDRAQLAELETLGELTERAWRHGCQVMIEGPGHVPFDQIEFNMKLQRRLCHGAPFYVLGPAGHRHLPRLRPHHQLHRRHRGRLPRRLHALLRHAQGAPGPAQEGRREAGVIAYKIAAHAADVALGIPGSRDRDDELTKARAALNWEKHFELAWDPDTARAYHDEDLDVDTDFCAMCGHDWCSVRISKEIGEFFSGKDEAYAWDRPTISAALSPEQREILERRGVLAPEEVHRLAGKTRRAMGADRGHRGECHSDVSSDGEARGLQSRELDPVTLEPLAPPSP